MSQTTQTAKVQKEIKVERENGRYDIKVWSGSCEDAYRDFTEIARRFEYLGTGAYMLREIAIGENGQPNRTIDVIGGMHCPMIAVRKNRHLPETLEEIPFYEQRPSKDRQLVDYVLDSFAARSWKLVVDE